jgi:hypothetical protein
MLAGNLGRLRCVASGVTDLGRSLSFPFRHPAWLGRVLIGAALEIVPVLFALPLILSMARMRHHFAFHFLALVPIVVLVGLLCRFLVLGYLRRTAKGVLDGTADGLPGWDRPAEDIVEGLKLWLVSLILFLPAIGLTAALTLLFMALTSPHMAWLPLVVVGMPALLVTLFYLPAGLLATVAEDDILAAFAFDRVAGVMGRAFGAYLLAILVAIGAEILAQLGLVICCVGIFATRFAAHCVGAHAFAVAYRQGMPAPLPPPEPPVGLGI